MNWEIIISAILGSSITTALLNAVFIFKRDRKTAKRSKEYRANNLAGKLENFAVRVYKEVNSSEAYFNSGGRIGENICVPDFESVDMNEDYEFLTGEIRDEILRFQDNIVIENANLTNATSDLEQMYLINEEVLGHIKTLGFEAIETAVKVRKMAGLSSRKITVEDKNLHDILRQN